MGTVYLVGAGPGDPELITRKGAALLAKAGCVVYDRLVNKELLKLAPARSEKIYAGKSADEKGQGQRKINRLLVQKAARHSVVVRLKGGDPALFGRMSEEIETLEKAGVPFEVVPGVSSVWAAATLAGIPLTDRRFSSSVALVTGHRAAGRYPSVRWKELARGADTLVVLMGRAALSEIASRLKAAGRPASTPVALVRWASAPQQEVLVSTIGEIDALLKQRPEFGPPVVAIIGEVARLGRAGRKPLQGKSVLVTRPAQDSAGLARKLEALGAECRTLPSIAVRPAKISAAEAMRILAELPRQDWVLFNSRHGVETLQWLAARAGKRLAQLIKGKVCVIGPRTAEAARAAGLKPALVPEDFSLEGIRRAFGRLPLKGKRIFIPRSDLAIGDPLAKSLRARGAKVEEAAVYETVELKIPAGQVRRALKHLDAATFTSASTVRGFLSAVKQAGLPVKKAFNGAAVVAIGPATARELRKGGVKKIYLPKTEWTVDGMAEAVVEAMK